MKIAGDKVGGAYDNSNNNTNKGKKKQERARAKANSWTWCKRVRLPKQSQLCRIRHRHRGTSEALWCNPDTQQKGWIMTLGGGTLSSLSSTRRQAGAECLLLENGAQLHACPIEFPGQRIPLPDPGIHTACGVVLQHDGGRLVRFKLSVSSLYVYLSSLLPLLSSHVNLFSFFIYLHLS